MTLYCESGSLPDILEALLDLIEHIQFPINDDFVEMKSSIEWKSVENFVKDSNCLTLYERVSCSMFGVCNKS